MKTRQLRKLIQMMSSGTVEEIEIARDEETIRMIVRKPLAAEVPMPQAVSDPRPAMSASSASHQASRHIVRSPMVGRFYSGTGPAARLRVETGAQVRRGEALCVIEALAIPTPLQATRGGTVTEVFCRSGDAVEYGQPLLAIE